MSPVRAFFGSPCPHCRQDILQAAPSSNRMPGEEKAWCPSCDRRYSAAELANRPRRPNLLKRLFGGNPSST